MRSLAVCVSLVLGFAAGCGLVLDLEGEGEQPVDAGGEGDGHTSDAVSPVDAADPSDATAPADAEALPDAGPVTSRCAPLWVSGSPPSFASIEVVSGVNSSGSERNPVLSTDGLTLWFQRESTTMVARRATLTGAFVTDGALPGPINVAGAANGRIFFTADDLEVFLASTRDGRPSADIWHARRRAVTDWFDVLTVLPTVSSDSAGEHDPHVSTHGSRLYYTLVDPASDDTRLWTAARQPDGTYAPDGPVAELVEPGADDTDPTISADASVILFTRNDSTGLPDLMYAVREPSGAFGPTSTVDGLSTVASEGDAHLSADACEVFFMRNTAGNRDIWRASLEE